MSSEIINFKRKTEKPAEIKQGDFDFDYWSKLAKDPEAFEVAREAEINKHIASINDSNAQERMRRLQWRVEMERKRSSSPLNAASRIYDMMWASVGQNIKALDELAGMLAPKVTKTPKAPKSSKSLKESKIAESNFDSVHFQKDNNVLKFAKKRTEEVLAD